MEEGSNVISLRSARCRLRAGKPQQPPVCDQQAELIPFPASTERVERRRMKREKAQTGLSATKRDGK